jgi:glycosyltransferase involved in cell wall biosynthesis
MQVNLDPFRVVAILAVRNERHTIARVLHHLHDQGLLVYVIDNESDDGTSEIIGQFPDSLIIGKATHPYPGYFDWEGILARKQKVAVEIESDWYVHCDADEILEAPLPFGTLKQAIFEVDRMGYNAINFDEFVFVPGSDEESWEGRDFVSGLDHYYHFAPRSTRLVRAWRSADADVDLVSSGGHHARFAGQNLYPDNFILRHYITLSLNSFKQVYGSRRFSETELQRGWHGNRVNLPLDELRVPDTGVLKTYRFDRRWDTSDPWKNHYFEPS